MRSLTCMTVTVVALVLGGCGGGSSTSQGRTAGTAAGEAFVCMFNQVPIKTAPALAQDYTLWINGKVSPANFATLDRNHACGELPAGPLTGAERTAATTTVRSYAEGLAQRLLGTEWTQSAAGYLHAAGL